MTTQPTPIIVCGRDVDDRFLAEEGRDNLVAANISDEADRKHGIEPGIGQVITIVDDERRFTGKVIDRTKVIDPDARKGSAERFCVDIVIELLPPVREVKAEPGMKFRDLDQLHFTDGDQMLAKDEVVLVNGVQLVKVSTAIPRMPDGSCTFWCERVA